MMITSLLDKEKKYHMNDLTLREKIALMEEIYGKGTYTIKYVNGSYINQAKGVVYITSIKQWRAQLSVDMNVAKSLVPFFRNDIKRKYKNSQFIVI